MMSDNTELKKMIIQQLCADGHDDLAHSALHLMYGMQAEIERLQQAEKPEASYG